MNYEFIFTAYPNVVLVVKKLPANAGNTGSTPGPRRSHMPRSNQAPVPQPMSLCFRAWELQQLKPERPRACAL